MCQGLICKGEDYVGIMYIFGVYEWVAANQLQLFCRRLDFERLFINVDSILAYTKLPYYVLSECLLHFCRSDKFRQLLFAKYDLDWHYRFRCRCVYNRFSKICLYSNVCCVFVLHRCQKLPKYNRRCAMLSEKLQSVLLYYFIERQHAMRA